MAVGSVVNALAIIRHLAEGERLGVNAIARVTSISPSTCFNILKTLAAEGFVEFDPETKLYGLGSEPARLFGARPDLTAWTAWLGEAQASLANDFDITCGLWQLTGERLLLTQVEEGSGATRIHLVPGQRLPANVGAMGRCIAASQSLTIEAIGKRIASLRWQRPPTPQAYQSDIENVARHGWAIDEGFYLNGVTTIAAAILNSDQRIVYCLTSTMFSSQHEPEVTQKIGERTADLARDATLRLEALVPEGLPSRKEPAGRTV